MARSVPKFLKAMCVPRDAQGAFHRRHADDRRKSLQEQENRADVRTSCQSIQMTKVGTDRTILLLRLVRRRDDLSARVSRAIEPFLRGRCRVACREWAGEYLLPSIGRALPDRLAECRQLSRNLRRACHRAK